MRFTGVSERFIAALEQNDLDALRTVPKGDLHNHCWMGGRIAYVEQRLGCKIERPPVVQDAAQVFEWVSSKFMPPVLEVKGRETAIEAAFAPRAMVSIPPPT